MEGITIDELVEQLRKETQDLFGEAIQDWIYRGVEFKENGPALLYYQQTREVSICLSNFALSDIRQLIFQLSHEVCHLLHPQAAINGKILNNTLVINEGLSTYYCVKKMNDLFGLGKETIESLKGDDSKYYEAYILVEKILQKDTNSIKRLRSVKPRIDDLNLADFSILDFEIDMDMKMKLISKFYTADAKHS